jgi:hypothetical protein
MVELLAVRQQNRTTSLTYVCWRTDGQRGELYVGVEFLAC